MSINYSDVSNMNIHPCKRNDDKMDVQKSIESVRQRPSIHECTRKAYKDSARKDKAWAEIAEEIGQGVTVG